MPGIFDQTIVNQVQQANDIVDVVGEHVSLKKKGREMVGLCPFHDDHRPSMNVNVQKQIFKCFACGAGGDVFKFIQMRENLTFPQAIERLAERAGIQLPKKTQKSKINRQSETCGEQSRTIDNQQSVDPNELARVNTWAVKYFRKNLDDSEKGKFAREYIAQRKISSDSVEKWQLGLALDAPDDLLTHARQRNIPAKLLEQAGLVTAKNQDLSAVRLVDLSAVCLADKFVNRLMFTITDVTGRVIGFGGRALSDNGPKYINSPTTVLFDKSNSLYGLEHARHRIVSTETAVVVEGYTDCIMAHQFDCTNVVATLGTSLTTGHGRILRRYAKKVVLIYDSDAAGIEAANRALDVCLAQRIDIKLAFVPQGKDPCDFLLSGGSEKFQQLIDNAVDVLQFKWDRLTEKLGADDTFAGRKAAVDEYLQTVANGLYAGMLKSIEGGLLVNRLSKIIGLDSKDIMSVLSKAAAAAERSASYTAKEQNVTAIDLGRGLAASAQREILEVLLNRPKLFETVSRKIAPVVSLSNLAEHFDTPLLRQTAEILFDSISANPAASLSEILAKAESVELGNCIMLLEQTGREKGNFESRLTDAVDALLRLSQRRSIDRIKSADDPNQYLKSVSEAVKKENRRNIGMT